MKVFKGLRDLIRMSDVSIIMFWLPKKSLIGYWVGEGIGDHKKAHPILLIAAFFRLETTQYSVVYPHSGVM